MRVPTTRESSDALPHASITEGRTDNYDATTEAQIVCDAIGSTNGLGTVTAACSEAFEAGRAHEAHEQAIERAELSERHQIAVARAELAEDEYRLLMDGHRGREAPTSPSLDDALNAVWDAAWALNDPAPDGQQWKRPRALKEALDALIANAPDAPQRREPGEEQGLCASRTPERARESDPRVGESGDSRRGEE